MTCKTIFCGFGRAGCAEFARFIPYACCGTNYAICFLDSHAVFLFFFFFPGPRKLGGLSEFECLRLDWKPCAKLR